MLVKNVKSLNSKTIERFVEELANYLIWTEHGDVYIIDLDNDEAYIKYEDDDEICLSMDDTKDMLVRIIKSMM